MLKFNKTLTVIIPVNNSKEYIDRLLDVFLDAPSVVKAKYEVIIIDDGSTNGTYKYLEKFYAKYKGIIKIYKQKNKGEGGVINNALQHTAGKYIKILHPEDTLDLESLSEILNFLEANDYDLIINGYELNDRNTGERKKPSEIGFDFLGRGEVEGLGPLTGFSHKNLIYRTEMIKKFNFKAVEDFYFTDMYTTL
jgi:glycosyltransferase involved in cell wall biosynthesis